MAVDDQFSPVLESKKGGIGFYQIRMMLFLGVASFTSYEPLMTNFENIGMDFICEVPELSNFTFEQQRSILGSQQCYKSNADYSRFMNVSRNFTAFKYDSTDAVPCKSFIYRPKEFQDSQVHKWNLVCDRKWMVGLVGTVVMAGFTVGSITGGFLADRYGRRPTLIIMAFIKIAANILATFSPYYFLFCIARCITGFAATSCYNTGYVICVELVGTKHRNVYGMTYAILYSFGFMYIPLAAFVTRHYFTFKIAATAPMLLMLFYPFIIPESPRWLILQGRKSEAEEICKKIASVNGNTLPEDFSLHDEGASTKQDTARVSPKALGTLFATRKMRTRTSVLFANWLIVSLIFYALSLNAGALVGDIFLNMFLLGFVEIPANLIIIWAMNRKCLGRKKSHIIAFLIAGIACLLCVPVIVTQKILWLSTVFAIIGKAGSTAAFNGLFLYTSELYPTRIRNLGVGVCGLMARIGGMMASFAGGSLGDVWRPLPSLLFGILGTTSGLLTLFLPETLNKKLPDTLDDIENSSTNTNDHENGDGFASKPDSHQNGATEETFKK